MNIQNAKQEIIRTILTYTAKNQWGTYAIPPLRQRPILLIGPPGIGKTAIMEQAAKSCGVGFVSYTMTHHTRQSAIGLPFIEHRTFDGREYAVTEYTISEIIASVFRCIEESGCREGLLFLDEINCVSETLAPTMLQFLQTKTFGSHRLPEGWILAAAGNPPEYNKSVREFDIATLDRLKYIEVEADYDAWRAYALEMNIHGAILSYLDTHRDRFYLLKQSYSSKSFATARGWEDLSCLLWQYEAQNFPVTADLILQYLHEEELAQDFAGYYGLFTARKAAVPVSAMMRGDAAAEAVCRSILDSSSFDEKLGLVHLMLTCFGNELQKWTSYTEHQKQLGSLFERLQRYQKQQNISEAEQLLNDFYQKEQEVLAVRREHGLSSEGDLQRMQQALYDFRGLGYQMLAKACGADADVDAFSVISDAACEIIPFLFRSFTSILDEKKEEAAQEATQLRAMLERSVTLLASADGAEFTFYLSSIYQNPLAAAFLKQYPSELCEQYREKLNFASREEQLRKRLNQ